MNQMALLACQRPRGAVKERLNRFIEMNFSKEPSRRHESHNSSSWLAGGTQMYVPYDVTIYYLMWSLWLKEPNMYYITISNDYNSEWRIRFISYSKCRVFRMNSSMFLHGGVSELLFFKWLHWSAGSAARVCSWVVTSLSILSPYSLPAVTACIKLAF